MTLSNLTASGWVLFALAAYFDVKLLIEVVWHIAAYRGGQVVKQGTVELLPPIVFTIWLLWLVTP